MARRVWIIARKDKVEESDKDSARLNGCSEIVNGIPPALRHIISEGQLPIVYEEPELPPSPPLRDLEAEIDAQGADIADLKLRVKDLEKK